MDETGSLTVRELVEDSGLKVILVAGESGLDKAIKGIHLSDLRDPTPYMISRSVLLTTGPLFASDPEPGIALLERLATIDAAALGIAVGHHVPRIHPDLVERAGSLGIPLLEIPYGTPLRTIVAYVYHALASSDMHRLRRTVAVQNHLLSLLAGEKDVGDLLASVAALLEMPILLFDRQGKVVAHSGATDPDGLSKRLWHVYSHVRGKVGPLGVVEEGADRFYFREVVALRRVERILAAAPQSGQTSEFTEMSLSFLQGLLTLELLRRRDELAAQRRMRQHLLREFLSRTEPSSDLIQRLSDQGVNLDEPWRVSLCVVQHDGHASVLSDARRAHEAEENLLDVSDSFLSQRRVPYVSMPQPMSIVVLSSFSTDGEAEARELLNAYRSHVKEALGPLRVSIGCSAAMSGCNGGSNALQQAREACLAASQAVVGDVVLFEDMSGRFRVLDGQSVAALRAIQARAIATLREYDTKHGTYLLATLRALLESGLALQPTADALFIHRNTLQKRLHRIEQLLNVDLTRLDDIVELYLGLRAAELLGDAPPGEHKDPGSEA